MKQCTKCEKEVELSMFGKQSNSKDGLNTWCFNCCKQYQDEYKKSIRGVVKNSLRVQRVNSVKRGHEKPNYSLDELYEFALNSDCFNQIYSDWVNSDYDTWLKPSFDRINNEKGYSFDNIKITTRYENVKRSWQERKDCKIIDRHRSVIQMNMDGNVLGVFSSISEAHRSTGVFNSNISYACSGKRKTAGGYKWKYS